MTKAAEFKKHFAIYRQSHEFIARTKKFVGEYEADSQRAQISGRLDALNTTFDRFRDSLCILELLSEGKEDDPMDFVQEMGDFEEDYFTLKGFLENQLKPKEFVHENRSSESRILKLPDIKLPEFSGNILKWFSFYDTFESLVHNNHDLSDVQKFYYLKSTLRGEAFNLIEKISVTSDNYSVALKVLTDRYQNKNVLIRNHIESLFLVEKVKKECPRLLTRLLGDFENNLGILEKLGEKVDGWSSLLVYMITSRLDQATYREWQRISEKKRMPTYDELVEFLRNYIMELDALYVDRPTQETKSVPQNAAATTSSSRTQCPVCGKAHRLYYCEQFKHMSLDQRTSLVSNIGICANCLFGQHSSANCKYGSCRECGANHHTLLHNPTVETPHVSHKQPFTTSNVVVKIDQPAYGRSPLLDSIHSIVSANAHSVISRPDHSPPAQVFLATAVVKVFGPKGNSFLARVLLDNASQPNLMTERFRRLIASRKSPQTLEIAGVGGEVNTVANFSTVATVASRFNNFRVPLEFVVMEKVTNDLPTWTVDTSDWVIPDNIRLADPSFATRGPIDIVIGAQVFFELLRRGHFKIAEEKPILQNSVFEWLVSGRHSERDSATGTVSSCHVTTLNELDQRVSRFWELETCHSPSIWSTEEKLCEENFVANVRRNSTGRYVVSLPKNAELVGQLGNSLSIATRRFLCLEKRFQHNPELFHQYKAFMDEYLALGHMKLVSSVEDNPGRHFYLPHHAVLKPDSTTTNLRVVFDGSCKTTSGFSLNDLLLKGPTIQDDMISTILRFRTKAVVITADITKMYRQIWVTEDDQSLQQILWRESPSQPIRTYQLTTVTYGTTTAPFLATRCLKQLADDEAANYPAAAPVVRKGFYVDDLMYGFDSLDEAIVASKETSEMLSSAGFPLRKWSSNESVVIEQFPIEFREQSPVLELDPSAPIKALGLLWKPKSDELLFKIPEWPNDPVSTKRSILSHTCSLFDPLGLLGPVIVSAKILISVLWQSNFGWDDPLPQEYHQRWTEIAGQLSSLQQLSIPRFVLKDKPIAIHLIGFADASLHAYGACVYFRTVSSSGSITVQLMAAKSRVAPSERRRPSLARLELCAAVLLANLQQKVLNAVEIKCPCFLWSDSTITLHWIDGSPSSWNIFVANRVAEIQQLTESATWLHVRTEDNPADYISRGLTPVAILDNYLWWHGPQWLSQPFTEWPKTAHSWRKQSPPESDLERRKAPLLSAMSSIERDNWLSDCFESYDSLHKVLRVLVYCRRYATICRAKKAGTFPPYSAITPAEIRHVELALIVLMQQEQFPDEYRRLQNKTPISNKSPLRYLRPVMFEGEKIIRVGGRLKNAPIPFDRKHPILLPKNHRFTDLVFLDAHEATLHAGPSYLLAAVRRRFWPIDGRNKARSTVHQCIVCFRNRPTFAQQAMADLPAVRVTPSRPFANIGVDFMGPVYIKPPRKHDPVKAYICVFICMVTKAVHLELVMSLTTDAFIAALIRFCSRRGYPLNIYCDNATNFVGANRALQELRVLFRSQQHQMEVAGYATRQGITFHFIPPRSPSFGGLWEACVKSAKNHLNRVTIDILLTQEEMTTIIIQIEACLNSRPLTPISNDPSDLEPLTPGHFLIGSPLQAVPEPDLTKLPSNRLSRWQNMQRNLQSFWSRWYLEYLPALQRVQRWPGPSPNLSVGDMVLVQEDNHPPTQWPIARVVKTIAGDDKRVRVADVLMGDNKIYRRSIRKMCPLPQCVDPSTPTESECKPPARQCSPNLAPTIAASPAKPVPDDCSYQADE
ncbi:uncharacterized protein LOC129766519 [Toxorhynchites rutilus septentrionalis]|uniref:uncharacterized protein LOC129766519 n=1 Tax=Toxorhynchites rutilus septentrionalis TaxID=329112 RepID=UPI002479301C|nr:uncharacterized protein LOC129766519 [Toxorhynchites rutilus septentrionalis]